MKVIRILTILWLVGFLNLFSCANLGVKKQGSNEIYLDYNHDELDISRQFDGNSIFRSRRTDPSADASSSQADRQFRERVANPEPNLLKRLRLILSHFPTDYKEIRRFKKDRPMAEMSRSIASHSVGGVYDFDLDLVSQLTDLNRQLSVLHELLVEKNRKSLPDFTWLRENNHFNRRSKEKSVRKVLENEYE